MSSTEQATFEVDAIRKDFPLLRNLSELDEPLIYLDSAATAQRPQSVIDAEIQYLTQVNAAVKRGSHRMAEFATDAYETARAKIAAFINAAKPDELIFTKNATESLNLLAYSLGNGDETTPAKLRVQAGDEILITEMEHHSNLVPWQELARRTGAKLRWIGLTDDFTLDLQHLDQLINKNTKVIAFTHQSNVLGTVNPVKALVERARVVGALTILDACQSVAHMPVDVQELGVDFLAFSGHKMLGPTGIGGLYGKYELLAELPPFLLGGSMIEVVHMDHSTYAAPPARFEAGTPMTSQAIALAAAVDYLNQIGMDKVASYEQSLTNHALKLLSQIPQVRVLGQSYHESRVGAVSFSVEGKHPHDIGQVLDAQGIQVRTGHHCAWPLHRRYATLGTTRASFSVYNTKEEISAFAEALEHTINYFEGFKA